MNATIDTESYRLIAQKILSTYLQTKTVPFGLKQTDLETLLQEGKRYKGLKVTRPQNSWILYRKAIQRQSKKPSRHCLSEHSARIAERWKHESQAVIQFFEWLAEVGKRAHSEAFPDFKYKSSSEERRKKMVKKATRSVQKPENSNASTKIRWLPLASMSPQGPLVTYNSLTNLKPADTTTPLTLPILPENPASTMSLSCLNSSVQPSLFDSNEQQSEEPVSQNPQTNFVNSVPSQERICDFSDIYPTTLTNPTPSSEYVDPGRDMVFVTEEEFIEHWSSEFT